MIVIKIHSKKYFILKAHTHSHTYIYAFKMMTIVDEEMGMGLIWVQLNNTEKYN